MARLKTIKPMLATLKPKITPPSREQRERVRLKERDQNVEYRKWYKTSRWQRLRETILVRDSYTCQATGVILSGKHPAADSPVVDHINPHRGDPDLFWDPENLRTVAKHWHDSIKQAMEREGMASSHPDWLRPSLIPLTIVCGPPASGKTTYVKKHANPDDLIIDLDRIASELAGTETHGWDRDTYLQPALFRRNDILGSLSRPSSYKRAWFIVGEPQARWRQWWQDKLKPEAIVVIATPEAECLRRVHMDPQRPSKGNADGIVRWWCLYEPRPGETVL